MSGPPTDRDLEALIAEFEASDLRELHVRRDGFELYLSKETGTAGIDGPVAVHETTPPAAGPASVEPEAVVAAPADLPPGAVVVQAPYLGTFYRAPKPGSAPYVEAGDAVTAETEICLVEVMKLFTAVRAGVDGRVHAILAADGEMVVADQPLFAILPG